MKYDLIDIKIDSQENIVYKKILFNFIHRNLFKLYANLRLKSDFSKDQKKMMLRKMATILYMFFRKRD
jgi:hypothetical protein